VAFRSRVSSLGIRRAFAAGSVRAPAAFFFQVGAMSDWTKFLIAVALCGAASATALIVGMPRLWELAKPTLRALAA
jgi:hypothetical protein